MMVVFVWGMLCLGSVALFFLAKYQSRGWLHSLFIAIGPAGWVGMSAEAMGLWRPTRALVVVSTALYGTLFFLTCASVLRGPRERL